MIETIQRIQQLAATNALAVITNSEFCVCDNLHHPTCPCGADFARADAFCTYITNNFNWYARNRRENGRRWFYENGMGDYRGRSDCSSVPVVWSYNQVNDESGMGGVVTFDGAPVRVAKLSNMMVAYACEKIGVCSVGQSIASGWGTANDDTADMSWNAGRRIARNGNAYSNLVEFVRAAWPLSDVKVKRLWPNNYPVENHLLSAPADWDDLNYNYQFMSPGFMEPTAMSGGGNEDD